MNAARSRLSGQGSRKLRFVFWLDVTLLIAFVALEAVPSTGLLLHEWLGLGAIAVAAVHVLLSWTWIASTTRAFFRGAPMRTRVNYFLNVALFTTVSGLIFSGIMISQEAVPAITASAAVNLDDRYGWDLIHNRLSDAAIILAGLHLAINWTWSLAAARKIFG